jgi:hypothetical protein
MDTEDNAVPEFNAANADGGAEKLNADPVTPDVLEHIDSMLDAAEAETQRSDSGDNSQDNSSQYSRDTAPKTTEEEQVPRNPDGTFSGTNQQSPFQQQQQRSNIDPEIAAIEQPRNLSEKNQSNWRKLQETASMYKRQAAETEALRQRLEQQQREQQLPPDYDELRKFRQIFDIKNDPEFQTKYEAPINSAKETVYSILRKNGAPEDVIKSIEAAGGPDKVDQNWWKKNAIDKLPMLDAEMLKKGLVDVVGLKQQQQQEIEHAAQHAEEYMQQKTQKNTEWYGSETQNIYNHIEKVTENLPWARFQQIPQGATQQQVEKIQAHNKNVHELKQKFDSALWPTTAQDRANVAAAATFSHVLTNQLRMEQQHRNSLQSEVKRLTEENSMLKGSSKIPRPGAKAAGPVKSTTLNDRIKMSASDAIDLGLDEASE